MIKIPDDAVEVSRESLQATAHIIGEHSAAAKALKEALERVKAGEEIRFFMVGQKVVVASRPAVDK
ncbi:TPA: hypothetical protein ACWLUJ_005706 [Pseudomonas aeruginosa]|nr:hypothetical protein [Pseudomonas aeruginosa]EIU2863550.1 hypothetical protein [Pseudomonas aeruginosa]HEJ2342737.1 hypothetical protein [Pseudomonas aeruginosa]HEK3716874.1 hypothetical protein [Pseudomonas aeruginosa]